MAWTPKKPKVCRRETCRREFWPTGPAQKDCDWCRGTATTAVDPDSEEALARPAWLVARMREMPLPDLEWRASHPDLPTTAVLDRKSVV